MPVVIHVVAPQSCALYLDWCFRVGGGVRLWRDAAIGFVMLALFALWQPNVTHYDRGPLNAAGVSTFTSPFALLAAAAVIHAFS